MSAHKLNIKEIQNLELGILIKFSDFCKINHLKYMLCGGTLLGAIRHKGFIPWDDDVDVLMPRPDYDRILNDAQLNYEILGENIEIRHWKNGKSNYPFIKFIDKRATVKTKFIRDDADIGNIWIDIFPLDGNPSDMKNCKRLYKRVRWYRHILMLNLAKTGEGKTWYAKIFKPIAIELFCSVPIYYLCEKIDSLSKSYPYNESEYLGGVLWGYGTCERMKREYYNVYDKVQFEEYEFYVPVGYQEYLTNLYGNYMELPPEKEREKHIMECYLEEDYCEENKC